RSSYTLRITHLFDTLNVSHQRQHLFGRRSETGARLAYHSSPLTIHTGDDRSTGSQVSLNFTGDGLCEGRFIVQRYQQSRSALEDLWHRLHRETSRQYQIV